MPFVMQATEEGMLLELAGELNVRHADELAKSVASSLGSGMRVTVTTRELEAIDTSILQLLVSLRKTAGVFVLRDSCPAFIRAVDRCALRRELLVGSKESC